MVKVVRNCSLVSGVWGILVLAALLCLASVVGIADPSIITSRLSGVFTYGGGVDAGLLFVGSLQFLFDT